VATAPISRGQVEQGGGDSPLPIGSRLPSLTSSAVGGRVQWRNLRAGGTAVIFLQGVEEGDELDYITSLQALAGEYGLWDGRVIAVVPGLDHSALDELETVSEEDSGPRIYPGAPGSVALVTEPQGEAERCGLRTGEIAILIADRWGQIYHGARGSNIASLPEPAELTEWFRFLSMQCPECGVIDEP